MIIAKERVLKKENQGTIFRDVSLKRRYLASFRFFIISGVGSLVFFKSAIDADTVSL